MYSGGSRSFAKETRALKMRSTVAIHWKFATSVTEAITEPLQKLILLQLHKKLSKNSILAFNVQCHSTVIWHLKQIGKVKRLNKWVPYELTEKSKKSSLWSVIIFCFTQQWTISRSNCDVWQKVDFIRQLVMTSSMAGPRSSSKALAKAKFAPNKRTWSLFGGLLQVWSTTPFRIPAKSLHLRSRLSKSMRCIENCNACSQHWSTERAQFFMLIPDCTTNA